MRIGTTTIFNLFCVLLEINSFSIVKKEKRRQIKNQPLSHAGNRYPMYRFSRTTRNIFQDLALTFGARGSRFFSSASLLDTAELVVVAGFFLAGAADLGTVDAVAAGLAESSSLLDAVSGLTIVAPPAGFLVIVAELTEETVVFG